MQKLKSLIKICIPDKVYLKLMFRHRMGKKLNLNNPGTYNEKLQWLKLYDRNPEYIKMVDKYDVREYIKETIGEQYLISLIGVYNSFDEIDFTVLPNQFVLKCTHDSGGLVICKDKSKLDFEDVKNKINRSLRRNYYYHGREWPYKNVKPRIICEELMVDESGYELKDYKFFCFNGEVKIIQVDFDRHIKHKKNLYDTNWNVLDVQYNYPNDKNINIPKPEKLLEMIELSEKLSIDFPFLRVDFYSIENHIFFGELTLFPASGFGKFQPEKYDSILGSWIKLKNS